MSSLQKSFFTHVWDEKPLFVCVNSKFQLAREQTLTSRKSSNFSMFYDERFFSNDCTFLDKLWKLYGRDNCIKSNKNYLPSRLNSLKGQSDLCWFWFFREGAVEIYWFYYKLWAIIFHFRVQHSWKFRIRSSVLCEIVYCVCSCIVKL